MPVHPPRLLILASQSPRRAQLLRDAGYAFEQRSPPYADPDQPPDYLRGEEAEQYAVSLAKRKANSMEAVLGADTLILAADTICVNDQGSLVGKPADRDDARAMLASFMNSTHRVITGVALLPSSMKAASARHTTTQSEAPTAESFADTATVTFGAVSDDQFDAYLDTDGWQGKAGGYNLLDRQAAGWPIDVEGDPATVVGLPMRRLGPLLAASLHSGR